MVERTYIGWILIAPKNAPPPTPCAFSKESLLPMVAQGHAARIVRPRPYNLHRRAGAFGAATAAGAPEEEEKLSRLHAACSHDSRCCCYGENTEGSPSNRAPMTKGARGSGSWPAMPARSTRLTRPRLRLKRKRREAQGRHCHTIIVPVPNRVSARISRAQHAQVGRSAARRQTVVLSTECAVVAGRR